MCQLQLLKVNFNVSPYHSLFDWQEKFSGPPILVFDKSENWIFTPSLSHTRSKKNSQSCDRRLRNKRRRFHQNTDARIKAKRILPHFAFHFFLSLKIILKVILSLINTIIINLKRLILNEVDY